MTLRGPQSYVIRSAKIGLHTRTYTKKRFFFKFLIEDLQDGSVFSPQDPVLLLGSVRLNLDPLSYHSDLEIWQALKQVSPVVFSCGTCCLYEAQGA